MVLAISIMEVPWKFHVLFWTRCFNVQHIGVTKAVSCEKSIKFVAASWFKNS